MSLTKGPHYNVVPLGTTAHYTEDFVFIYHIKLVWLSSPPWMALFSAQVALFKCSIQGGIAILRITIGKFE